MELGDFFYGFVVGITAGAGLFILGLLVGMAARLLDNSVAKLRGTRKEDKEEWTEQDYENAYYGEVDVDRVTYHPEAGDLSNEMLEELAELHRHSEP